VEEVTQALFHATTGYTLLLALEEAAAHVEYLYQRSLLAIDNLGDLERETNPVLYYRTR